MLTISHPYENPKENSIFNQKKKRKKENGMVPKVKRNIKNKIGAAFNAQLKLILALSVCLLPSLFGFTACAVSLS